MVMGKPNVEVGDSTPQAAWLARCITHLLEHAPDKDMTPEFARQEAHQLWEVCGPSIHPEDAADRWLGRGHSTEMVRTEKHADRPIEDSLGHDMPAESSGN